MKNRAAISLFALIIAGLAAFIFLPVFSVLEISNRKNPEEKYFSRQAYKDGFVINYTHSVNKGRVHDFYHALSDNQLELNETVFVSYGAGIPEPEETEGAEFFVSDNGYHITNLHRVVPKLVMAVGIIANHSIEIDGCEYFLTDYFAPQTSIILEIKRISLFNNIKSFLKGQTIPKWRQ